MKKKILFIALFVFIIVTNPLYAQIDTFNVYLPVDVITYMGDTVDMQIGITDTLKGVDSVFSFDFTITFDDSQLHYIDYDTSGFLAAGFTIQDTLIIGTGANLDTLIFSGASSDTMLGIDEIMILNFWVDTLNSLGDTVGIYWEEFVFNEGPPACTTITGDGSVVVGYFGLFGDVNQDTLVDPLDASAVLKYRVKKMPLDSLQEIAADVSGNGSVFAYDAALILMYDAGLISSFPAGSTFVVTKPALLNKDASAELYVNELTNEYVEYYIKLNDVTEAYSADITVNYDNTLFELESYELINAGKYSVIEGNNDIGIGEITLAMATVTPITNDKDIVKLRFRIKGKIKDEIPVIMDIALNERYIEIIGATNIPRVYSLYQNYPNPFNPETTIKFDLPKSADVTLRIYNVIGQEVRTLINEHKSAGNFAVKWDSRNDNGVFVSSGIYLYKLKAGNFVTTKKMVLLR